MLREAWNGFMRPERKGAFDLWQIYNQEKEEKKSSTHNIFSFFFSTSSAV